MITMQKIKVKTSKYLQIPAFSESFSSFSRLHNDDLMTNNFAKSFSLNSSLSFSVKTESADDSSDIIVPKKERHS